MFFTASAASLKPLKLKTLLFVKAQYGVKMFGRWIYDAKDVSRCSVTR